MGLFVLIVAPLNILAESTSNNSVRYIYSISANDGSISKYNVDKFGELSFDFHQPLPKYPKAIGLHPSQRYLYVVSKTTATISAFKVDSVTGDLTPITGSPFAVGVRSPFSISFHPNGKFLYLAARAGAVAAFSINADTGQLTVLPGSPVLAQRRTRSTAIHPSGRFIYASNAYDNSVSAYAINSSTGALQQIKGSPYPAGEDMITPNALIKILDAPTEAGAIPYYVAIDSSGGFLFVTNWLAASLSVFAINKDSGQLTPVFGSPFRTGINPFAVSTHPSAPFVYVSSWEDMSIWAYKINLKNGRLTPLKNSPFPARGRSPVVIKFDPLGNIAYIPYSGSNRISVFSVDRQSGQLSFKHLVLTRPGPMELAVFSGKPYQQINNTLFRVDKNTGVLQVYEFAENEKKLTLLDGVGADVQAVTIATNNNESIVYTESKKNNSISAFKLDSKSKKFNPLSKKPLLIDKKIDKSPITTTVDPNNWYLYNIDQSVPDLSAFKILKEGGGLEKTGTSVPLTGKKPTALVIDPIGRYAFVVNSESNNISVFVARKTDGPLLIENIKYGSPYAAGEYPVALAIDPKGRFVFVANAGSNNISVYRVNIYREVLSEVSGSPFPAGLYPYSLTTDRSGRYLYVVNRDSRDVSQYRINQDTAALTKLKARLLLSKKSRDIKSGPQGRYIYINEPNKTKISRFRIDHKNGRLHREGALHSGQATADYFVK